MYSANQIVRAWILVLTVLATGSSLSQRPAAPSEQTVQSRAPETAASAAATPDRTRRVAEQAAYGELPLYFEANQGPTDKRVQFLARGTGFTLFLTATEATLALKQKSVARSQKSGLVTQPPIPNSQPAAVLRMYLVSANPHPRITGEDELPGKSHYFFSGNPTRWHTNIPTYAKVRYQDVYPGVDLLYDGTRGQVEYDFIVAPGADPTAIRLAFAGLVGAGFKPAPTLEDATGDLVLNTASGELRFHRPRIHQDVNGSKQPVTGRYVLRDAETPDSGLRNQQVGFELAAYDPSKPLVIDPVLVYSTYLGGSSDDRGNAIAVDSAGNAYVTGTTASPDFPTPIPVPPDPTRGSGLFVVKLNAAGSALLYSAFIGGLAGADVSALAVDAAGNAYVTGSTLSIDFPTTARAFDTTHKAPGEFPAAFVTKLDPTGSALAYSTFLGGSRQNFSNAIAVDGAGNAYVTGWTTSPDFPTVNSLQPIRGADAFVAKIADGPPGIMAFLESPEDGPVSGIAVIRGWAFATKAGVSVSSVELFIDGQSAGEVPCCSTRGDVQTAFLQFPTDNTLNSGWGAVFNWGVMSAGPHTVRLFIRSTSGELFVTDTRTVTVVKPGDSEYLDQFDLSQATTSLQGEELTGDGILVRDKSTQQQKRINTRFRWFEGSQSLGMVEATTVAEVSSLRSFFAPLFTSLSAWLRGGPVAAAARDLPQVESSFEGPEQEQVVSGIGVIRGWAFAETGGPIRAIGLVLDGQWSGTIPCCSQRADVAAAYPDQPAALPSGWGTVFNYGLLSAGPHTVGVTAEYWSYVKVLGTQAVTVVRPGGFEFLDQFDLSQAAAQVVRVHPWSLPDGEEIRLEGVKVRDKASQQEKVITVQLRWFVSSQALGIVSSSD